MIWFSLRQQRFEVLALWLTLAGIAAFLVHSGLAAYTAYYYQVVPGTSMATCLAQHSQNALCQALNTNFFMNFSARNFSQNVNSATPLLPALLLQALVGMFVGVPLVAREMEQGTHSLIWTQSVTRVRWLAIKAATYMSITLLAFALFSILVMWWNGPFDRFGGGVAPVSFDFEGIVPVAYAAYALALGIATGALLRKTVPAMFVTLLGYSAARIPADAWARLRYLPPVTFVWDPYTSNSPRPPLSAAAIPAPYQNNDWVLYSNWVDHAHRPVYVGIICQACSSPPNWDDGGALPHTPFTACTHAHGWLYMLTVQPPDRFWLFQSMESAIFFGLAALLLAFSFWWVRTRIR